jgi:ATP-dependent 26S proteasome regulatory subunit
MAGLDNLALQLIKNLAENKIQDAKKAAIACCANDDTKKNAGQVNYYKNLLENGSTNLFELPMNLKGMISMQDVSGFNEARYFVGNQQRKLLSEIQNGVEVTTKLLEYGIPHTNSTLIFGIPGTGKTEFAKYTAYKLGLPYAYVNFSFLIESYMGKTSQNLQKIFDYCKGEKCVLMLDEIDCIGLSRGHDTGADGELGRTTISLMQALDGLVDGQIVIAATNREDRLDKALLRRFQRKVCFERYAADEEMEMIKTYINSVDESFLSPDMESYAKQGHTQAETVSYLIECISKIVVDRR